MNNVILIGFMGAGKTTVGSELSKALNIAFIDTDKRIEEMAEMTISEIFKQLGEEAFRRTETSVLEALLAESGSAVISTGGGLPLREENQEILKRLGTVAYLKVSKDTVIKRLAGDTSRPLLSGDNAKERVDALLREREPLYRKAAHLVIDADNRTVEELVKELKERMEKGL